MKIIIISLLTFYSYAFAQVTLEQCVSDAFYLGSQTTTPKTIPLDCSLQVKENQNIYNFDFSNDGLVKVYGSHNLLFTEIYNSDEFGNLTLFNSHMTSGKQSALTNILAVDINESSLKTYVLNENNGQYYVFSYFYTDGGNNVPVRKLISSEITKATNIKINSNKKLMYVISESDSWVKVFNELADPDGPNDHNKTDLLQSLSGANTELINPKDITFSTDEVFILDNDRVLVFNISDDGDVSPKRIILGTNTTLLSSQHIEINTNNEIQIINGDDSIVKFLITAIGNAEPIE